jgi:hypothetical protein
VGRHLAQVKKRPPEVRRGGREGEAGDEASPGLRLAAAAKVGEDRHPEGGAEGDPARIRREGRVKEP